MGYVLLTRQNDDNNVIVNKLLSSNIMTYNYPLINLQTLSFDWRILTEFTNLIITSKFAAKIVTQNISHPVTANVVGIESASILKSNPFITINNIFSTVFDLKNSLLKLDYNTKYAYISSNIIKKSLPRFVKRFIVYQVTYTQYLSHDLKEKIKNLEIKFIMIYSENSARTFIRLCRQENLCKYIKSIIVIALSKNIYKILSQSFLKIVYCTTPNNDLMLDLLYQML